MGGPDDRRCIPYQDSTASIAEIVNSPRARCARCSDLGDCMGTPLRQEHRILQAPQTARLAFATWRRPNAHGAMPLWQTASTSLHCRPTSNRLWWKLSRFASISYPLQDLE